MRIAFVLNLEEHDLKSSGFCEGNTPERITAVTVEGYPRSGRNIIIGGSGSSGAVATRSARRFRIRPSRILRDIARGDIKSTGGDRADSAGGRGIEPCKRRPNQHDCTQKHAENADAQRAVQAGFLWLAVPRAEPVRTIHFHNGTSFLMI